MTIAEAVEKLPVVYGHQLRSSRELATACRGYSLIQLQYDSSGVDLKWIVLRHVALHCVCRAVHLRHTGHRSCTCTITATASEDMLRQALMLVQIAKYTQT